MKPTRARPLMIVADDLTGACDTGALFAGRGPVPVSIWPRRPPASLVSVVDTESRSLSGPDAAERLTTVATGGRTKFWFKKIDSTLRGAIGPEVDALMRATGTATALVCPAFPAQRRVVIDRALLVAGTPVAATPVARDPHFPGGTSSVVELLRPQLDRAIAWIPLDQARAGVDALTARMRRLAGTAIVADAETDADLDALVEAALAAPSPPLLVGSAGLGRALAARLGLLPERVELPVGGRWLVIGGSAHPATRRQLKEARAAGLTVLATPDRPGPDRAETLSRLVAQAVAALERERWDVVVVTGGETAVALWSALGVDRMEVLGAPVPGLALGQIRLPGHEPLPVLTKAGGFGPPDLLVTLQKEVPA